MKKLRDKLTYANVVATLALFVAVGGATAFAATRLPHNSVGAKQIKKGAVTGPKLGKDAVTASKVKDGSLSQADLGFPIPTETKTVANNSITTAKLANGSVTASKLGKLTQLSKVVEVAAGKEATVILPCNKGETLLNGGGGFVSSETGAVEKMTISSSRQPGGNQSWAVEGFNGYTKAVSLQVSVLCLAG